MKTPRRLPWACALFVLLSIQGSAQSDTAVHPFTISVPDATLADLKARLKSPRIPEPLKGDGWDLGTDVTYLRELVDYWRDRFDWRAAERRLNQMEQFTTTIDGPQRLRQPGPRDGEDRQR